MGELLVAIGIWCGNAVPNGITPKRVNLCQQALLECVSKLDDTRPDYKKAVIACFEKKSWFEP